MIVWRRWQTFSILRSADKYKQFEDRSLKVLLQISNKNVIVKIREIGYYCIGPDYDNMEELT